MTDSVPMGPPAKADEQAQVEDISIWAVWDGDLGHAVQVSMCVKVNSRPGTCQVLMHRSDELVEDASVTDIREIKPLNAESGTRCEPQKFDEFLSDGPCIPATQQPFGNWDLKTPHKNRLARLYRDITSARCFSAAAAAERWQEIKEADCSRPSGPCYPNTEDGYAQLDRIDSQHRQPTRVDPLIPINTMQYNSAPSSVASTSKTSSVSDCSSPSRLNVGKYRKRVLPSSHRRSPYHSELFTCEEMENLRTRIRLGLPQPVWDVLPETRPISKASPRASTKKPWIPPALSDLSSANKVNSSTNSGTKPGRHLKNQSLEAKSTETKKMLDTSVPGKHSSRRQPPDNISESTSGNGEIMYNRIKSAKGSRVENTRSTTQRQSELPEMSIERGSRALPEACHRSYSLGSSSTSPPVSPRQWLRHRSASAQHSKYFPPTSLGIMQAPTWVVKDRKLCVVFPEDVRPGTFEIDIQAKIRLSLPISPYRHSFSIPGLIRVGCTQEHIPTGNFSFFLKRPEWVPGFPQLRFAPENLMDCRIKESSHVIGRFRLNASPTLLVRLKAPVFHVLDFSAAVEMCTSVVPMTEREVGLSHRVKIVSENLDTDIFADRVDLFLVVRNGLLEGVEYQTRTGTCTILHESILGPTGKKENEALIKITRDLKDLRAGIDFTFTIPYRLDSGPTPYPTVRPLFGEVISETIVLTCPRLPLILEHIPQAQLSSWETLHYTELDHAIIRLDRVQMPKCFPEGLRDDPLIRISELDRVPFRDLRSVGDGMMIEDPVYVARDLRYALHELPGGQITCRISVDVEVGQNDSLLVIDPQGWDSCYSLINHQLATEQRGQWRKTEDDYLMLFGEDSMIQGNNVHIEFRFKRNIRPEAPEGINGTDARPSCLTSDERRLALPKIIGKTSLGTIIKSDLEQHTVHLTDESKHKGISQTVSRRGLTKWHLPRLTPKYRLSIGYTKPSRDAAPPKPSIKPEKPSSSELCTTPCQVEDRGTNRVRFADLEDTTKPVASGACKTSDDMVVATARTDVVSTGNLSEATAGDSTNAATVEKAAATVEGKPFATTGLLSWILIISIALIAYLVCISLEGGSTATPFSNVYAASDPCTGLTPSLYKSDEGGLLDSKDASGQLYGDPVDVSAASSKKSDSDSLDLDEMQSRHGEKRMLDIIDRALGWKGQ